MQVVRRSGLRKARTASRRIRSDMLDLRSRVVSQRERQSPIVVLTMGKVGSSSLEGTIRESSGSRMVLFGHDLVSKSLGIGPRWVSPVNLDGWRIAGLPLPETVTAVRDPIARDISLFFEMMPQLKKFRVVDDSTIRGLEDGFQAFIRCDDLYISPDAWFEQILFPAFQVNLFEIGTAARSELLSVRTRLGALHVLRTNSIDRLSPELLTRISLDPSSIRRASKNVGEAKSSLDHYTLYTEFKAVASLPSDYVERSLESKTATTFFSGRELESLMSRWDR